MLKKRVNRVISLMVVMGLLVECTAPCSAQTINKRTIVVQSYSSSDRYTSAFDESNVDYDEESDVVNMTAVSSCTNESVGMFDRVSLVEDDTEELEDFNTTEDEDNMEDLYITEETAILDSTEDKDGIVITDDDMNLEDDFDVYLYEEESELLSDYELTDEEMAETQIEYTCSFDMEELLFEFSADLLTEDGTVIDTESMETEAFITENGGLDAYIEIEGETYLMSDYENISDVDDCCLEGVLFVILVYLAVAERAELVKAKSNYTYNKKLETDGKGVDKGYYITDQTESLNKGKKCANYKFGFTTFRNVGCEVAAAYNMALALGDSIRLSEVIVFFEYTLIEFSIGWGKLGSNPLEINRFLKAMGYQCTSYTSYSKFKSTVSKKTNCKIIMSRWNDPITTGLHTFYVKKSSSSYYSYNWEYDTSYKKRSSLDSFNDGSGFIVGYIVWK